MTKRFLEGHQLKLRGLSLIITLFLSIPTYAQGVDIPTFETYNRVMQIRTPKWSGTAFTVEVDNRQYLITARHVLEGVRSGDKVELRNSAKWASMPAKFIDCPTNADIVVLVPPHQLIKASPTPVTMENALMGQDMFFFGFPYGLHTPMEQFNVAFVKKGIFSAGVVHDGVHVIYIDGYNNIGFSGGPIMFRCQQDNKWHIAGVVSGYRWNPSNVISETVTNAYVKENTGIVIGYDIRVAVEAIKKNPIGPKVTY